MTARARSGAWPIVRMLAAVAPLLAVFLILEIPLVLAERRLGLRLQIEIRPAAMLLFFYAGAYGVLRVLVIHPVFREGYRDWLKTTPWTSRKRLPLGPVELSWEDGLVLGLLLLLAATLPQPRSMLLLCTFLLAHLLTLTVSLWRTQSPVFAYATAFVLGLAVRFWHQPLACVVAMTGVYVIAYEGLRRAMARFPWEPIEPVPPWSIGRSRSAGSPAKKREPCGWPYDRLMGEVIDDRGIRRIDAVVGCLLATWWFDALVSLVRDPSDRLTLTGYAFTWVVSIAPVIRLAVYINGYRSPLSPWARLRTFSWMIPGYDQVFIGPLCVPLAGLAAVVLLRGGGAPLPTCLTAGTGMAILAALITPPRLRRWRLVGDHRIVAPFAGGSSNEQLIKVT